MNRISTPIPALTSASVVATCVCSTHGPSAVWTVIPSALFSSSTTDDASRSANPYCSAWAPGIASFWCDRSATAIAGVEPTLDRRVQIGRHVVGLAAGRSGPAARSASRARPPPATQHPSEASPRRSPAPGTGPTHTSTGTGSSTRRCARATPSRPIVPAESTCNTITARSATASIEVLVQVPVSGRSIAPSTLITSTRFWGSAGACAWAANGQRPDSDAAQSRRGRNDASVEPSYRGGAYPRRQP